MDKINNEEELRWALEIILGWWRESESEGDCLFALASIMELVAAEHRAEQGGNFKIRGR